MCVAGPGAGSVQVTFQARDRCGALIKLGGYQELAASFIGPLEANTTIRPLSVQDVGDGTYVIPFTGYLCGNYSLRVETKSVDLGALHVCQRRVLSSLICADDG